MNSKHAVSWSVNREAFVFYLANFTDESERTPSCMFFPFIWIYSVCWPESLPCLLLLLQIRKQMSIMENAGKKVEFLYHISCWWRVTLNALFPQRLGSTDVASVIALHLPSTQNCDFIVFLAKYPMLSPGVAVVENWSGWPLIGRLLIWFPPLR